jgi:predicted nucleic acid-binding protein
LIDASVAVKFALDEEDHQAARQLSLGPICAPELILSETANGWWKSWRKGAISAAHYDAAILNLPSLFDELFPIAPVMPRAVAISQALAHPVYDCVYLAYAEQHGSPVVTADLKLLNKIAMTELAGLCEPLTAQC